MAEETEAEVQSRIDALAIKLLNTASDEGHDVALEAAIDHLYYPIVEGWLSPGEKIIEKAVSPDYDFLDRAEMAARIGSELPDRVEAWWAKHGRAGVTNGELDPLGMREAIKHGWMREEDVDEVTRGFIEAAGEGPAQARIAAVRHYKNWVQTMIRRRDRSGG
jgi:hypothetical protein